jgi:hypothetical protein
MNKQCWRCRMYLPAAELQQYRGQLTCPYCIQDLRYADARENEYVQEKHKLEVIQYPEQCERCGRDLEGRVYIWNGKKLCKKCMEDEQDSKWGLVGGGPMHAPQRMSLKPENERKQKSFIENALAELLYTLRLKKRPVTEAIIYGQKMPIQRAKPMNEEELMGQRGKKTDRKPQAEGIIKSPGEGGKQAEEAAKAERGEYAGHGEPFEFEGEGAAKNEELKKVPRKKRAARKRKKPAKMESEEGDTYQK